MSVAAHLSAHAPVGARPTRPAQLPPRLAGCVAAPAARCTRQAANVPVCERATTAGGQRTLGSRRVVCFSVTKTLASEDDVVRFAAPGDIVSVDFVMRGEDGEILQSTQRDLGEPLTFEVGAGDMMGNRLFQGFDEAVRGMAVGQTTVIEASGGEWKRELLFTVPRAHPEVERLEGRYKNHGGLAAGLVVELANGGMAVVVEINESVVRLDANNMLAGKKFTIELTLSAIDTVASLAAAEAAAAGSEEAPTAAA